MILRWWRRHNYAVLEEWNLIALKPSGLWASLAIASSVDGKPWVATTCIDCGGSTWMGSSQRAKCATRSGALRAAERFVGVGRTRRVRWPAVWAGGWDYPPPVKRGRQRSRSDMSEIKAAQERLKAQAADASKRSKRRSAAEKDE